MKNLHERVQPTLVWYLSIIFVIAVVVNYAWEIAQVPFFVGLEYNWATLWHCFVASLGDGIMLWIIYVVGLAVFRRKDWFADGSLSHYAVMLLTGLILSIAVEWIALEVLNRWAYNTKMPMIPVLDIGLMPVLQMLLLPPLIFSVVTRLERRHSVKL